MDPESCKWVVTINQNVNAFHQDPTNTTLSLNHTCKNPGEWTAVIVGKYKPSDKSGGNCDDKFRQKCIGFAKFEEKTSERAALWDLEEHIFYRKCRVRGGSPPPLTVSL